VEINNAFDGLTLGATVSCIIWHETKLSNKTMIAAIAKPFLNTFDKTDAGLLIFIFSFQDVRRAGGGAAGREGAGRLGRGW